MQIYIMRHGEAQDFVGENSVDDSQRVLSARGEVEAKIMIDWFEKMPISPKHVFVSPYVRARQTCDIVTSLMDTIITPLDFITPLDDAKPVHDFIDGWLTEQIFYKNKGSDESTNQQQESLLIISHMPLVSFLVAELTQSNNTPIFATAGVAHIEYDIDKMQGTLQGMICP